MALRTTIDDLTGIAGITLGPSSWRPLEQAALDGFAALTGEDAWIHADPARAQAGPFGATIAPSLLVLSLVPAMVAELLEVTDAAVTLVQAVQSARFPQTVPSGTAIRATVVPGVPVDRPGGLEVTHAVEVGRDGGTGPVCAVDLVLRHYR